MSIFDKDLFGSTKHDLALQRIRTFCAGKTTLVAFSGGKDSQCCYHLCEEAGVSFSAQYSITRFEPPELLRFIRENYSGVTFRRAFKRSLVADIEQHGLPTRWVRWCCDAKHVATPGYEITVVGVRAQESPRRANTWRFFGFKPDHTAYVCPIIDWSEDDVWEYLSSLGKPHCSLYDEGFRRIGCVCCPLATSRKMQLDALRWPKTAAMLRVGSDRFVARMRAQGFVSKSGKPCPDWCKSVDPEREYFSRWIATGQTVHPVSYSEPIDDVPCLFAGSGFCDSDGLGLEVCSHV